jgi:hypothetical protein
VRVVGGGGGQWGLQDAQGQSIVVEFVKVGFGRAVVSEIEAPNNLANLA